MNPSPLSVFFKAEAPTRAQVRSALKPYGFHQPQKAWEALAVFAQNPSERKAFETVLPNLLLEFSHSPDPDLAVGQFATYAENPFHQSKLFQYLQQTPAARQVLARVFGLSPALASTLFQEPELLYWLFDEDGLYAKFSPVALKKNLEKETASAPDESGKLNALRRVKRRRMLRLGARDLMGLSDVKDLTFELSGLADALLDSAIQIGKEKLAVGNACVPAGRFVIMAMGKLGGQELNYSSDIDLLFVYEPAGRDDDESDRKYFNELAEWVIQAMTEPSSFGNLFKVDMRLRPEGSGDMARSLESYLQHYEARSQPWELQALLKTRPCAGDLELGEKFIGEVAPFIFRRNFDSVYLQEIREIMDLIKRKMETQGRARTQVKLGRGGIREIEFIVQFLQLVHGGQKPGVRIRNTLDALEKLAADSLVLKADAQFLSEAYRFLRNVEHRLQMVHGLQTHTLPKKAADMESLARSLGFKPDKKANAAHCFKAHYSQITGRVRALYEEVFKIKRRRDSSSKVVEDSLADDAESLAKDLAGGFFFDAAQAASNLRAMARRLAKTAGARGERLWTAFVPELFNRLGKVPHPDRALNQLESFLRSSSLPDLYLRYLLGKPALLNLLLELFSNSLFLSEILIVQPGNFDIVAGAVNERSPQALEDYMAMLEERLSETSDWEEKLNLIRDTRNSEILRVGVQDLLGQRDLFDCFAEMSRLALAVCRSALGVATDQLGLPTLDKRPSVPAGFCLMGMGKLGGWEMNYGSDLDLLFIYDDERGAGFQAYLDLAETFTRVLSTPTGRGTVYQVDARLRPMGRESQMAHSVEAYRQYFHTYAQAAERLAYTRCLFLAGDRQVGNRAQEIIEDFTYGKGLTRKEFDEILDIRRRMEEKAAKARGLEFKASPGGIVDIEFIVQILQLAYGRTRQFLRMPHTPTAMQNLREGGILSPEILDELKEAYRFYRLLEARHRMVRESAEDVLPEEPERLRRLAWRMGLGHGAKDAEQMVEKVRQTQEKVRAYFKRLPEWIQFQD
jgi:[glutamine synthetase] adenylyltransferase / [glutamine synthetase]-adenylyl-L-tyrosine phosphorylase